MLLDFLLSLFTYVGILLTYCSESLFLVVQCFIPSRSVFSFLLLFPLTLPHQIYAAQHMKTYLIQINFMFVQMLTNRSLAIVIH